MVLTGGLTDGSASAEAEEGRVDLGVSVGRRSQSINALIEERCAKVDHIQRAIDSDPWRRAAKRAPVSRTRVSRSRPDEKHGTADLILCPALP